MNPIRRMWSASSAPAQFFADFPEEVRLWAAVWPALLSVSASSLIFAWAITRATSSDAWLPILVFVVPGALLYCASLWLLGGLALARTANLDLRGWELAAWAWVPSGFMALSLLPVIAVFPVTSLIVGLAGLPVWHLAVVHSGLNQLALARRRRALIIYALVVLAAPLGAIAFGLLATFTL